MIEENELDFKEPTSGYWAEIILPLALPNVYTYSVPQPMVSAIQPGCRAEVLFGKNKKYAGIIKSIVTKKIQITARQMIIYV